MLACSDRPQRPLYLHRFESKHQASKFVNRQVLKSYSLISHCPSLIARMKPKIVIALNTAWNLYNFRAGLIRALVAAGYEVVAVAPPDVYAERLPALGCRYVPLTMDNKGTHPGRDALLAWRFWRLLRREKPMVYLGYTVKPNVYGSLAAQLCSVPVINNIAGLGAVFIKQNWVTKIVRHLYRLALSRSKTVFFQNDDDRQAFVAGGLVQAAQTALLPGSGIDLQRFAHTPLPSREQPFRFLLAARLLRDKGVVEFVEAARQLQREGFKAEFCILGFLDVLNPQAINRADMQAWVDEGAVQYLGVSDDVRQEMRQAHCVVLPSYREGTPRSLLEAAALGRPIVTTNAVGCREVVDDGVNGYLCPVQDALGLADAMRRMMQLPPADWASMGQRGRDKMEREFDEKIVIERYLNAIKTIG
jgi:glycosyltransferase involved in cell wall biosynthesis